MPTSAFPATPHQVWLLHICALYLPLAHFVAAVTLQHVLASYLPACVPYRLSCNHHTWMPHLIPYLCAMPALKPPATPHTPAAVVILLLDLSDYDPFLLAPTHPSCGDTGVLTSTSAILCYRAATDIPAPKLPAATCCMPGFIVLLYHAYGPTNACLHAPSVGGRHVAATGG